MSELIPLPRKFLSEAQILGFLNSIETIRATKKPIFTSPPLNLDILLLRISISVLNWIICIYADQPFKINNRIKIAGYEGTVSEIGGRSTRLKTLEGRLVTMPNSKFDDAPVENSVRSLPEK